MGFAQFEKIEIKLITRMAADLETIMPDVCSDWHKFVIGDVRTQEIFSDILLLLQHKKLPLYFLFFIEQQMRFLVILLV